ncbi:hypothetical protein KS419_19690, partial [Bacillus tamaricis]
LTEILLQPLVREQLPPTSYRNPSRTSRSGTTSDNFLPKSFSASPFGNNLLQLITEILFQHPVREQLPPTSYLNPSRPPDKTVTAGSSPHAVPDGVAAFHFSNLFSKSNKVYEMSLIKKAT